MKTIKKTEPYIFCCNVLALRKRNNLSKKDMAKLLGIGIGSLNKLEKGIIPERMSCTVLVRISKVFHVPISYILGKALDE